MRREELTEKLSSFESKRSVGDWLWHSWRVWPAVRTRVALALHAAEARVGRPGARARLAGSLAWRRQRLRRWLGEHRQPAPDRPADVVFLSAADRGQRLGRAFYNTVVDPWAEELVRGGERVCVWQRGDPRWPGHVPHASIQRALDGALRMAATPSRQAPAWFEELSDWAVSELERDVDWRTLRRDLETVEISAALFEGWLRRVAPRTLVLDCWYGREAMGAAMAAHRLGISVVDLQHGVQGDGHPAYAGWSPSPEAGYEVFPDRFWVWGEWDAEALVANNPGAIVRTAVDVVGHRWLSAWVQGDPRHAPARVRAARLIDGRHAVLVTLQDGVPYRESLSSLIREAPRDWLWLVRLHRRADVDAKSVQAELTAATGRAVEAVQASRLPLHALLDGCAWHVTGFSTCALEALAFGVPTLLTHESGRHAYAPFVDEQVMWLHRTAEESVRLLASGSSERAAACRDASRRVFGEVADPARLLRGAEA